MNGKELKVVEYNLTFGGKARIVNVLGLFRYIKNNSLYVIYTDKDTTYNIINYGSSHIKNDSILSMTPKKEDEEIIKEYIFKDANKEELNGFEVQSLESINSIEIISSNKLEVKPEVIQSLIEKNIPKKELPPEQVSVKTPKKKNPAKLLLTFIIIFALLAAGAYLYLKTAPKDTTTKLISCTIEKRDNKINAKIKETITLNFNNKDTLTDTETKEEFQFATEDDYQDFINKGIMYKYMPENDNNGGFKQDDDTSTFTIIKKEEITSNYDKPIIYEEVLSYHTREGYICDEKLVEE